MKKILIVSFSVILAVILVALSFSACQKGQQTSRYVSFNVEMKGDTFKILQLTDAHFINSEKGKGGEPSADYTLRDEWAMTAMAETIRTADPDLLVVTGDTTFTLDLVKLFTGTNDNYAAFTKFADFIDSFDIPWLFCFGNHDEEGELYVDMGDDATKTKKALAAYLRSDGIKNCLFAEGPDEINGVGNYVVNVLNKDGSVNTSLVLFDSGSYLRYYDEELKKPYADQRKYEWVHDDQLDWYEAAIRDIAAIEGRTVPSIIFQHIPFPEYQTALDAYIDALEANGESWEDTINADWTFGTPRTVQTEVGEITYYGGIAGEKDHEVCCSFVGDWEYRKGKKLTYTGGREFERILSLGSTKYVFCGHDHRNTFSLVYKGVWLGYGMSIDYSANGIVPPPFAYNQDIYDETEQRGGTLITLDAESGVSVSQVPFTRNLYQEAVEQRGNGTK